jgi:hypothetical protein
VSIEAYDYGKSDGVAQERARIRDWVIRNRQAFELDDNVFMYRDSFNSEDLLRFIDTNEEQKEDEENG